MPCSSSKRITGRSWPAMVASAGAPIDLLPASTMTRSGGRLTTVVSRPPERVIVDAGNKSMGAPALATMAGHDLPVMRFDEEHGIFLATPDDPLRVGAVGELAPGYA